jgi:hypothetical protein
MHRIGWPGLIGLVLCGTSGLIYWMARQAEHQSAMVLANQPRAVTPAPTVPIVRAVAEPVLPSVSATPGIIKSIVRLANGNGINWSNASYRYTPLSAESLATLEIQTTLKGPYPKIKRLIGALLDEHSTMALREFTLTRANADAVDIEAKVRLIVFLSDDWSPHTTQGAST